jgi:peptidoglycan hydrolase-like protein with peptidoglycan-binding domain
MSDIVLLLMGVLKVGQPSGPNLSEQLPVQLNNQVQQYVKDEANTNSFTPTIQITPPEFIHPDRMHASPVVFTVENQSVLNRVNQRILSKNAPCLVSSKNPPLANRPDTYLAQSTRRSNVGARTRRFSGQSMPILAFGNSGVAVKVLQRLLRSNGYNVIVDGGFGAFTETAVKAFQNKRNLRADGIVGQSTWNELTR